MMLGHVVLILIGNASHVDGFDCPGKFPAWERLKAQGLELRSWISNPIGSHSNYETLFGEYPFRIGITTGFAFNSEAVPQPGLTGTLAHAMGQAGVDTAWFGKWNMGSIPNELNPTSARARKGFAPMLHGFGEWTAGIGSNVQPPLSTGAPGTAYNDWERWDNAFPSMSSDWCDVVIGQEAAAWLSTRSDSFTVVSFQASHGPLDDRAGALAEVPAGYGLAPVSYSDREAHLLAADYQIWQILDELNLADDRVVMFATTGSGPKSVRDDRILCPAVIAGPGVDWGANSNLETPRDLWARIGAEAGLPLPYGPDSHGLPYAYCNWNGEECVRTSEYKLVRSGASEELFDLTIDPGETSPIDPSSYENQELVGQLRNWMANP